MVTSLIFSSTFFVIYKFRTGYSDELIKQVWLGENSRTEESHKLRKEAKAEIDCLNYTEWDKQLFEKQSSSTVNETLTIFCP